MNIEVQNARNEIWARIDVSTVPILDVLSRGNVTHPGKNSHNSMHLYDCEVQYKNI